MMPDTSTLDIRKVRRAAANATAMLRMLANEDRLLLLCQLTQGERCVSELEEQLGIRQPTLSQQLGVLRTEGLVSTRREGKNIYYTIADERVELLLGQLYQMFCR
jgi:DNA-binding transcriptional ArsR family regulator